MPTSVVFSLGVESALILLTALLLMQPKKNPGMKSPRLRSFARWTGVAFLGATFCWSIILGVILSMNNLAIRI